MSADVKAPRESAFEHQAFSAGEPNSGAPHKHGLSRKRKLSCREERRAAPGRPQLGCRAESNADTNIPNALKRKRYVRNGGDRITLPKRFLLGGNITDPLNLNALCSNVEVGQAFNEVTPRSSPLPLPHHRMQVDVIVPVNINDPLNLNASSANDSLLPGGSASSRRSRRRVRNKKKDNSVQLSHGQLCGTRLSDSSGALPCGGIPVCEHNGASLPEPRQPSAATDVSVQADDQPVVVMGAGNKKAITDITMSSAASADRPRVSKAAVTSQPKKQFVYGNYSQYYSYRNPDFVEDSRITNFKDEWFRGKDVLDIGCNVGHITLTIARDFQPRRITGVDIDPYLISLARKNMRHYVKDEGATFPSSMSICYGPITPATASLTCPGAFPDNVSFVQADYSLERDELLDLQREEFDVILALSITKWLHLHHGDAGLKRTFRRMFRQLKPGGKLVLEPQQWPSYKRRKRLTETTKKNFDAIQFRPEQFTEYLLSKEVGFITCEEVNVESNKSKGFRRPLFIFTKASSEAVVGV